MKSYLDFSQLYHRLELSYQGLNLVFGLDLTCVDVNRFKRAWFTYIYLKELETQHLKEKEKQLLRKKRLKGFFKDFLKETLWAQERVVALVVEYLKAGKISLISQIKDKHDCHLSKDILCQNPYFYELLVTLAQRLSIWEEEVTQKVKKKPFWRSWFA